MVFPDDERSQVTAVEVKDDNVYVTLASGVIVGNPLHWFKWLEDATPEQRANTEFYFASVYFPDLDDGLDVESMIKGEAVTWAKLRQTAEYDAKP